MKKRTFWLLYVVFLFTLLIGMARCTKASAAIPKTVSLDTCHVNIESIQGFYIKTNDKGKESYLMVYDDPRQNIDDLIPVSQSVYEYIMTCSAMKIAPHLGIVFRNNQPTRVIKYRKQGYRPQKLSNIKIYKKR